jgi:hypothetical protein
MTPADQTQAFLEELIGVVQRFYDEFDLTYPQMIGALELVKADMVAEASEYVTVAALAEALEAEKEDEDEDEDEDEN